jgi:hypothetical protein
MANEISISASLSLENGEVKIPTYGGAYSADQTTAAGGVPGFMALTTTEAAISTTGVTTPGWVWMKNVGSQTVIWGKVLSGPAYEEVGRIPAGKAILFYIGDSVSLYAKAAATTTNLQVLVLDR